MLIMYTCEMVGGLIEHSIREPSDIRKKINSLM